MALPFMLWHSYARYCQTADAELTLGVTIAACSNHYFSHVAGTTQTQGLTVSSGVLGTAFWLASTAYMELRALNDNIRPTAATRAQNFISHNASAHVDFVKESQPTQTARALGSSTATIP